LFLERVVVCLKINQKSKHIKKEKKEKKKKS